VPDDARVVVQHLMVEISPDELREPRLRAARARLRAQPRLPRQLADGDGPEAQVRAQVARALDGREVARLGVVIDAVVEEVGQQRLRASRPDGHLQRVQVGAHESQRLQIGHAAQPLGHGCQSVGQRRHRMRLECAPASRLERAQPRVLVGREDAVGRARSRHHLRPLEDDMVLHRVQRHADLGQPPAGEAVALERVGVVVVTGPDGLHGQLLRQPRDLVGRLPVAHDEPGVRHAVRPGQLAQLLVEPLQAVADEFDAPVGARQRIQDRAVEHECAPHAPGRAQGLVQGGVVLGAQVATQPHERGRQRPVARHRRGGRRV
jgi:hypothetical protein